jgi:hypothetical protein
MPDKKKAAPTKSKKTGGEGKEKKLPLHVELDREEMVSCLTRLSEWLEALASAVDHSDGNTFRVPADRPVQGIMGREGRPNQC